MGARAPGIRARPPVPGELIGEPRPPNPLTAYVEYRISGTGGDDPRWDRCQVYGLAGWLWVGNRAGLRNYVAEQYAPIIAEAARLDASEPAARAA